LGGQKCQGNLFGEAWTLTVRRITMSKVVADISMSLDGFVTGPDPDLEHGLGKGGEPLHAWAFDGNEVDAEVLRENVEATGAVVMGRRLFDFVDGPNGWSDDVGYGAELKATPPVFVVTHRVPEKVRLKRQFTFITDGLEAAITAARMAAGEQDVVVMGGGDVVSQSVTARLVQELRIHLAPIVLGAGTPLFKGGGAVLLVQSSVRVSPRATHLTYHVEPR
jgi:dihydrofolate reductase